MWLLDCVLNGCLVYKEIAKLCFGMLILLLISFINFLFFCLVVVSFVKRWVLTSSTLSIYLSISPFTSIHFSPCNHFAGLMFDTYTLGLLWLLRGFFLSLLCTVSVPGNFLHFEVYFIVYLFGTLAFFSLMFIWYIFFILLLSIFL